MRLVCEAGADVLGTKPLTVGVSADSGELVLELSCTPLAGVRQVRIETE